MDEEFIARQIDQIRSATANFRADKLSLGLLLTRLEGAARAVGVNFWEKEVFATVLDLEQVNVDLVEERARRRQDPAWRMAVPRPEPSRPAQHPTTQPRDPCSRPSGTD